MYAGLISEGFPLYSQSVKTGKGNYFFSNVQFKKNHKAYKQTVKYGLFKFLNVAKNCCWRNTGIRFNVFDFKTTILKMLKDLKENMDKKN